MQCEYQYLSVPIVRCKHEALAEAAPDGKHYCIFHAPLEMKDAESFIAEMKSVGGYLNNNFHGFIFPEYFKWPGGIPLQNGPDFSKAEFHCRLKFRQNFHRGAVFHGALFFREVVFEESEFGSKAQGQATPFTGATFKEDVTFRACEFNHRVDFRDATFRQKFWMNDCDFEDIEFTLAKAYGPFTITDCRFHGAATFRSLRAMRYIDLTRDAFEGRDTDLTLLKVGLRAKARSRKVSNFGRTEFMGKVRFTGSGFRGPVSFAETRFQEHSWFDNVRFEDRVSFRKATFADRAFFDGARFSICDYPGALFLRGAFLSNIHPSSDNLLIRDLVYEDRLSVNFDIDAGTLSTSQSEEGVPQGVVKFDRCHLRGPTSILGTYDELEFERCILEGSIRAEASKMSETASHRVGFGLSVIASELHNSSAFYYPVVHRMIDSIMTDRMTLYQPNLGSACLSGSDLLSIAFIEAEWPKCDRKGRGKSLKAMPCLWEEISGDGPGAETLISMYRSISSNYEGRRHYGLAGHFKAGEYDQRRRFKGAKWLDRKILTIYRALSSYGESILKPLVWIIGVISLPAVLYLWLSGLPQRRIIDGVSTVAHLRWRISTPILENLPDFLWDLFSKALPFSLTACLPVRTGLISEIGGCLHHLPSVQRICFAVLSALLLFALRRKVKR